MILELGVIAATIAIAAGAAGAERRRRSVAVRTFEEYARSRSLLFVPPPPLSRGAGPRVEGKRDGASFHFDLYRVGSDLRTRVTAAAPRGVAPKLVILQRGVFTRTLLRRPTLEELFASQSADVGPFDRAYSVTGATTEDRVRLDEAVVPSLLFLDRRDGVSLVSSGDKVVLSWSGVEQDPLIYDAARDAALAVASWHRPDTPYR